MKWRTNKNLTYYFIFLALPALLIFGCKRENGELGTKATASFTVMPVAGKINTFALQSTSQNSFAYQWDKGTGAFVKGNVVDTAYFPLKGTYTVKLRAFGRGGYDSTGQTVTVTVDDILNNPTFKLLTAKSWKLNSGVADPVVVGTEGNPSQYFAGGALADCQIDDIYTFNSDMTLTYKANGATFNGGNVAPNYSCGTDRSYIDKYVFSPGVAGGSAGIASITLTGIIPSRFIGVTDVSSNNYRIISISSTAMVLRSGTASETVHQFKFVAQ